MDADPVQHRFSLIESIPPSADLFLAAAPVHPRTPWRSPVRRQRYSPREIDSFLSDLEPGFIFETLVASSDGSSEALQEKSAGKQDRREFIRTTVACASPAEKVWGVKAAHAGQSISEWHDELASWPWPKPGERNGFLAQYNENQLAQSFPPAGPEAYRASIPSDQIGAYEMKVEGIMKYLGMLELEDLKAYVRDAHVTPNSKRTSDQAPAEAASYNYMDDFTALITATIVQSLPKLARLVSLMKIWSLRLMIMRKVPDFIRDMASCKESMVSAQMATGGRASQTSTETSSSILSPRKSFSRNVFSDMRAVLSDQMSETSKKLDAMLDLLEGSKDVLPEQWIDTMDELEAEHQSWAVKAEELVLDNESAMAETRSIQEETLAEHEIASPPSQYLQISEGDAKFLDSLGDQPDNAAPGEDSHEVPSIGASAEIDQLPVAEIPVPYPARNVSTGVRKPTGIPGDDGTKASRLSTTSKPSPVVIERHVSGGESNATWDALSNVSPTGSMDSDIPSIGSSPEIRSATLAAYPGSPIQVTTPASSRILVDYPEVSKQADSYDRKTRQSWSGAPVGPSLLAGHQRKRSSTFTVTQRPSSTRNSFLNAEYAMPKSHMSDVRPRSASVKSFEVIPRSEVRTIEVRRSLGNSSSGSLPSVNVVGVAFPQGSVEKLPPYGSGVPESSSETSLPGLTMAQDRFMPDNLPAEANPFTRKQTPELAPTQISFAKARRIFRPTASSNEPVKDTINQQRAATLGNHANPYQTKIPLPKHVDRLEAQISSILTKIPADIRLTSAAEAANTDPTSKPVNGPTTGKTSHLRRNSVARLIRLRASTTTTPPITLAPAPTPESKPHSTSDIKVYHLHQPGSPSPTKIYIRLVGEAGERVMVRVGGGWADLAEYLKEYASHHGKRAVSENHFNIQSLPQTSSPATPAPSSSRPTSSSSHQSSSPFFFRRQQTTPSSISAGPGTSYPPSTTPPRTPSGTIRLSLSHSRPSSSRGTPTWSPTVTPSEAAAAADSPSPSIGLAGPKVKKVDISPRKQAWVEGVMRQARRTSGGVGEGGREGREGRVGGVKRVLLGIGGRRDGR